MMFNSFSWFGAKFGGAIFNDFVCPCYWLLSKTYTFLGMIPTLMVLFERLGVDDTIGGFKGYPQLMTSRLNGRLVWGGAHRYDPRLSKPRDLNHREKPFAESVLSVRYCAHNVHVRFWLGDRGGGAFGCCALGFYRRWIGQRGFNTFVLCVSSFRCWFDLGGLLGKLISHLMNHDRKSLSEGRKGFYPEPC